jgi:protein TonB
MSNVSIYEKNWTDLVFEDKNKAYGAYQLRLENPKTSLVAFITGIALMFAILGSWILFSSFSDTAVPDVTDDGGVIIKISDYNAPKEPETPKAVIPIKNDEPVKKEIDKKDLQNAVLVEDNYDEIRTNKEMKENPIINNQTDASGTTGTVTSTGTSTSTTGTSLAPPSNSNTPVTTNVLDRLPEFPGKMKSFYDYVANNINKPDVDDNVTSMNVIMSFVIEKDGSMSDIKALRSTDKNLEREAIRVLKALKIKWSPGWKDGEKVRTLFTLPIKVTY